jgi:hypothetical protein
LFAWCRNRRHCAICWQMFFYEMTVKVLHHHGVIYCIMFCWAVRSFSHSTHGATHLSEESCTNSSCNTCRNTFLTWLPFLWLETVFQHQFSFACFGNVIDSCQQTYYTTVYVGPASSFRCLICFRENSPMKSNWFVFNCIESWVVAFAWKRKKTGVCGLDWLITYVLSGSWKISCLLRATQSTSRAVHSSCLYSLWFNLEFLRTNRYKTRARIEHSRESGTNMCSRIEFLRQLRSRGTDGWDICLWPIR